MWYEHEILDVFARFISYRVSVAVLFERSSWDEGSKRLNGLKLVMSKRPNLQSGIQNFKNNNKASRSLTYVA